ncbi:MAG: hypothetical protein GY932_12050 [Arcobacter sp.]|nr:hypothetical protein [Flavobacteriaceae bacterium]MCP4971309.1 hypothetical protein [Arcobacter sp.]
MKNAVLNTMKELENLYSWSQFYQNNKNRDKVKVTQQQIRDKKKLLVDLKNNLKNQKKGPKK